MEKNNKKCKMTSFLGQNQETKNDKFFGTEEVYPNDRVREIRSAPVLPALSAQDNVCLYMEFSIIYINFQDLIGS